MTVIITKVVRTNKLINITGRAPVTKTTGSNKIKYDSKNININ